MTVRGKVFRWLVLLASVAPSVNSQAAAGRFVITAQAVASAMAGAGWKIASDRVRLLSQVTANRRDALLEVVRATKSAPGALTVELRCHDRSACLPFYVVIDGVAAADTPDRSSMNGGSSTEAPPATRATPVLKSGDPATLVFADKALHISMPVICLQSGQRGQRIRVASIDRRRFFKAEIVGPGLLKAITL